MRNLCFIMKERTSYLRIFLVLAFPICIQGHPSQEDLLKETSFSSAREKRAAEPFIEGKFEPSPEFDDELNLCDNATVDAIIGFNDSMRTEYVFRGPYYWKILQDKVVNDYPRLICDTWLGLPDNIDAGFVNRNSKIFFFKGSKYWQFSGTKRDRGFPKLIKEGFPGIPDDIQAVTLWSQTNFVYFFKGKHYWRFEPDRKPPVRKTYPKLIGEVWEGVPDDLDEAMLYPNGVTYFLKGLKYWKFNDGKLRVDAGYPAPNAVNWFGCKGDP